MNTTKLKKIGMLIAAIFGAVVLAAVFIRAKKAADAGQGTLSANLQAQIKGVTQTT